MECEVIAAGAQVCIIRIRLPDDAHPEHSPIEVGCMRHIFDVERQMSESAVLYHPNILRVVNVLTVSAVSVVSPAFRTGIRLRRFLIADHRPYRVRRNTSPPAVID